MAATDFVILGLPLLRLSTDNDSDMGPGNLAKLQASQRWRSDSLSPDDLAPRIEIADVLFGTVISQWGPLPNEFAQVSGGGLVNHNARYDSVNGAAKARLIFHSWAAPLFLGPKLEVMAPTAIVSSSGATGAVGDVDDDPYDAASEADYIELAAGGNVLLGFGTPSDQPHRQDDLGGTEVDNQVFAVRMNAGTVDIQLYEAAGALGAATEKVATAQGQIAEVTWTPHLLATASGANVELRIENTGAAAVRIYAAGWYAETNNANLDDTYAADTGWIELSEVNRVGDFDPAPPSANDLLFADLDEAFVAGSHVMLRVLNGNNSDGYFQAGVLPVGTAFRTALNVGYSEIVRLWDPSTKARTHGGQMTGSRRKVHRKLRLKLDWMTPEEYAYLQDQLQRRGKMVPFLVGIFPTDAALERPTLAWCTLDTDEVGFSATHFNNFATELNFIEEF